VRHARDDQAEAGPGVEPLVDEVQLARTVAHEHGREGGAEAAAAGVQFKVGRHRRPCPLDVGLVHSTTMLAPHSHAIHTTGPLDAGLQLVALAVVGEVQLVQQAHHAAAVCSYPRERDRTTISRTGGAGSALECGRADREALLRDARPVLGGDWSSEMKIVGGLLMAVVLALGSGCVTRPDWIERTLVTADVTGVWRGTSSWDRTGTYSELSLDLQQHGPKVRGLGRARGGPSTSGWGHFDSTGAFVEGTIAGDVFNFSGSDGAVKGELIVSGDEMTGNVNGLPFILRRVDSSSRPGRLER
jgi:hypothetical protein